MTLKSWSTDSVLTIDSQEQSSPVINDQEGKTGSFSLGDLLSKARNDVDSAVHRHRSHGDPAHNESVAGGSVQVNDHGGCTELYESLRRYVSSSLTGRRHRRKRIDERPSTNGRRRLADPRSLTRMDRDLSSMTNKSARGANRKGKKASAEMRSVGTLVHVTWGKKGKEGGMMRGKQSANMMTMSEKKGGMMGGKRPLAPNPMPSSVQSQNLSTASMSPSATPSISTVINQRVINFSAADCGKPCVDFGDVICLRASTQGSVDLLTTISYTVSDAYGSSESFDMKVFVSGDESCTSPMSTCNAARRIRR